MHAKREELDVLVRGRPIPVTNPSHPCQEQKIADLWMAGLTMREISSELGITRKQTEHYIGKLRNSGEIPNAHRRWDDNDMAALRNLASCGVSDEAIASTLNRSVIAVIRKRHKCRIVRG